MGNKIEILDIVDDNDNVVGSAPRDEVYEKKMNHRIVHVMIFDKLGNYLVQIRSEKAKFLPNYYSTSVGGHVMSGESYEEAAKREMKEELGLDLELLPKKKIIYKTSSGIKKFLQVYESIIDLNEIKINPEEVKGVKFIKISDLKNEKKLHPELKYILEEVY